MVVVLHKGAYKKNSDLYGWECFYKRLKQNELVVFNPPRSHGEHRALLLRLFSDESTKVADAPRSTQRKTLTQPLPFRARRKNALSLIS